MRTGRPANERKAALAWLEIYLSHGPVSAAQIRQNSPVGWDTTLTAKKELGIRSKKTSTGWFWSLPVQDSIPNASQSLPVLSPEDEPEDSDGIIMDTAALIACAQHLLSDGESLATIERELNLSCAQWPMSKPYPASYINSVARHVVNGTPIETLTEGL